MGFKALVMMLGKCCFLMYVGNKPAHLLAKHAISIVDFMVWMEENPYFLEQALHHDVMFSFV